VRSGQADKRLEVKIGGVAVKEYTYDSAGRTTAVETTAGVTTLAYDYEGRITGITYPNSSTNSFVYNGMDTRVSKTDSTGTRTYTRDGAYVTDPFLDDGAALYTPGVSERRRGVSTFNHTDRLGTYALQTDLNEDVASTRTYAAFGTPLGSTGSPSGPFGFAGAMAIRQMAIAG
jgi:YD repeat-containing protein